MHTNHYTWTHTHIHIIAIKASILSYSFFPIIYLFIFSLSLSLSYFLNFVLQKNPNDSRIHAAVEAMSPYGFPLDLVQVTVGELLNVGLFLFFL
jgi:hypothetical protein